MKKKSIIGFVALMLVVALVVLTMQFRIIKPRSYSTEHFNITQYVSPDDEDGDGIDDQTDILKNAKEYVKTRPKYKSKYYGTGYPDDKYGVCTDVVAQALLNAGYDLMLLVDQDRIDNPDGYRAGEPRDKNIDFRRVRNLIVYFENNWTVLTNDPSKIEEWQGGDIIVYNEHIGIVSDRRNKKGVPLVIHHGSPWQIHYQEDILATYDEIIGHYRVIKP